MYEYTCTVIDHHDGDTSHIVVDLGLDESRKLTIRWLGINAPELGTPEGKASLAALNQKLPPGSVCTIATVKDRQEKYGRYLATFTYNGEDINAWMVTNGYAVPYMVTKEAA